MHTYIYSNWKDTGSASELIEHLNGLNELLLKEGFERGSLSSRIGVRGRVEGYENISRNICITHLDFTETKITKDYINVECWCNAFQATGYDFDRLVEILSKIRDFYARLDYEISCLGSPYEEDRQARKDEISNTR